MRPIGIVHLEREHIRFYERARNVLLLSDSCGHQDLVRKVWLASVTRVRQNAFPKKGNISPQNITPTHKTTAETAISLLLRGASSPARKAQGSSNTVK